VFLEEGEILEEQFLEGEIDKEIDKVKD